MPWSQIAVPFSAIAVFTKAKREVRSGGYSPAQEMVAALHAFTTLERKHQLEIVSEYMLHLADEQATALAVVASPEVQEEDFPWHDPALPLLERLELARHRPLKRKLMSVMAQHDCGACGYHCQTYAEAIAQGEEADLTKCSPGGKETAKKLRELVASRKSLPEESTNGSRSHGTATNVGLNGSAASQHNRKNPFFAPLLQTKPLNRPGSGKDVRFVAFSLMGSGLSYEVGDALGLMPENDPELVEAVLRSIGARGDELVPTPGGLWTHSFDALSKHYIITNTSDALAALLAANATNSSEAGTLKTLVDDDVEGVSAGWDVLDMLDRFPSARAPIPDMIASLSPLQPRLYSISSSLKVHPNEVHLTVGVVHYTQGSRVRKGVASNFLTERLKTRQKAGVFVHTSPKFRLPADSAAPVIMVGPGTGIAPFRAFLEDRAATGAKGKNWLFFGDQRRDYDFLYQDELEGYSKSGVLTRLDTAFSRDQAEKIYVQDRMHEHGRELWDWVENGAYFYVCGDAKRMASDANSALHRIAVEQGGLSTEEAKNYVAVMTTTGRYQRDVY
jgi:sulfite reductase (NADPH) flavoprotein alpha-component